MTFDRAANLERMAVIEMKESLAFQDCGKHGHCLTHESIHLLKDNHAALGVYQVPGWAPGYPDV